MSSPVSSPLHFHSLLFPSSFSTSSSRPSLQFPIPLRFPTPPLLPRATNLFSNSPSNNSYIYINRILEHAHKVFDELPQPVKTFPWSTAWKNFLRLIFDLSFAVAKYLSLPVLAVSALSEMSYCGHEGKLGLVPFPILVGFVSAGVVSETASGVYPALKEGEFPLHLLLVGVFFLMLKLPGPYYPYWGRLVLPHVGNGGLLRTGWLIFAWYRGIARRGISSVSYDHGDSS